MSDTNQAQRKSVFVSGALLVIGYAVFVIAAQFHPHEVDHNNHVVSFTEYAHWPGWTADHLLFFVAAVINIGALIVLVDALSLGGEMQRMVARIVTVSSVVAIALSALRFLIDGVVLQRAVVAWATAPAAEQAARFASAETVRWMEEASGSYQGFMIGLAMVVLGALIVATARVPRPIGALLALSGIGYAGVGWMMGESGFAPQGAIPSYISQFIPVICGVYLLVVAWRMPRREAQAMPSKRLAVSE